MAHVFLDGTLGAKVRELSLPAFTLTEARYSASQMLPWHAHERASICVVLEGTFTEEFRGSRYRLSPFDLTFKPHGMEHRNRYDSAGARCLIVDLDQGWIKSLWARGARLDTPWFFSSGAFPDKARRVYGEFIEPDDLSGLAVETFCAELIVRASRHSRVAPASPTPSWLQRVRDYLHADCQRRLTLEQLAHIADVHPVHLAHTFRLVYSCTIGEYVRNLRVQRAAQALTLGDSPLATVAIDCGFYDQSHFNRVFKKHMNVTPAQYRNRKRTHSATASALEPV